LDVQTLQLSPVHPLVQLEPQPPLPAVNASAVRDAGGVSAFPQASVEQPVLTARPGGHTHCPPLVEA